MKKLIIPIVIVLLLIIIGSVFILNNYESNQQIHTMKSFLESYYTVNDFKILDDLENQVNLENIISIFDALYEEEYKSYITKDCYNDIVANRSIFYTKTIAKDFNCTMSLSGVEFDRLADTVDGSPAFSYTVRVKTTLEDQKSRDIVETGTLTIKRVDNKWLINNFYCRRELYGEVKKLMR